MKLAGRAAGRSSGSATRAASTAADWAAAASAAAAAARSASARAAASRISRRRASSSAWWVFRPRGRAARPRPGGRRPRAAHAGAGLGLGGREAGIARHIGGCAGAAGGRAAIAGAADRRLGARGAGGGAGTDWRAGRAVRHDAVLALHHHGARPTGHAGTRAGRRPALEGQGLLVRSVLGLVVAVSHKNSSLSKVSWRCNVPVFRPVSPLLHLLPLGSAQHVSHFQSRVPNPIDRIRAIGNAARRPSRRPVRRPPGKRPCGSPASS